MSRTDTIVLVALMLIPFVLIGAALLAPCIAAIRMRSTVRSVSHVLGSGAANGAIFAFGWRGFAVVPVVAAMSMLLARLHGGRRTPPDQRPTVAGEPRRAGSLAV